MLPLILAILFVVSTYFAVSGWKQIRFLRARYARYEALGNAEDEFNRFTRQRETLAAEIAKFSVIYEHAKKEIAIFTDQADMITYGFYTPRYDFATAALYKERLDALREQQKQLIQDRRAIVCSTEWRVEGSKAKGRTMTNHVIKLALNAFNVQCDNTILKVSYSNIISAKERLIKVRENIDKLLADNRCSVTEEFFKLKLDELHLAYEYEEKLFKEKEEQRRIKDEMREEEKVRQEIERAKSEAEKDEKTYQKALDKARKDLETKSEGERAVYLAKISELEAELKAAQEKKERALSQAQQTKRGHVYVISNIGSFGENIYKIGLTRRLEPMERVWELSDAALPFEFDVHAMIHSENAPDLERALHAEFSKKRVNAVNERKEFFDVTLAEIESMCQKFGLKVEFTRVAEAKEYRQTVALKSRDRTKLDTPEQTDTLSALKNIGKVA